MQQGEDPGTVERVVPQGIGALPAAGFRVIDAESRRRSRFPNVVLRTHEAAAVRFYDDLLKDKTVVISFMYTHCTDDCPLATANLVQVQKALGSRAGREVFIYSITVDPDHDTPPVLREYARAHGVG